MNEFRSDVVGSLLRPEYLKEARGRHEAGEIGHAEFKKIEDRAVDEAVEIQKRAGLDVVTDGEMRRSSFYGHLIDSVEGFDKRGGWAITFRDHQGAEKVLKRPLVVSRLKQRRHLCAEDFAYLRARISGSGLPAKATIISAQQASAFYDAEKSQGVYPTVDAYLADVVDILRLEVKELIRLGCRYIQVDAPQYAALLDPELREGYRQRGNEPDRLIDVCIEMDNAVIEGHTGALFALHLCRGNAWGGFYASGGYDPIAANVFQKTRFDRFLLEYDDERSGGFEPLKLVPGDRTVVLGLVTTKRPALENKDELKRRIREASKFVPLERLALSPQCGFASEMEGGPLTIADEEAKLRLVAEPAGEVWG
jgi:5-methyltetrahydropteroyltriglutamate--homocysteine methyltransferase